VIIAAGQGIVRTARPGDAGAIDEMFGRCSPRTRYRRFHAPVAAIPAAYLRRCLDGGPDAQRALVAEPRPGRPGESSPISGLASAGPVPGAPRVREAGVLVEDAWQRQGVGRALFAELLAGAGRDGVELIRLELCRAQPSLAAYVFAHLRVVAAESAGCDVTVDVAVEVPAARVPGPGARLRRRRSPAAGRAR
jgi:GNAT superfamily N-acetyltransferase